MQLERLVRQAHKSLPPIPTGVHSNLGSRRVADILQAISNPADECGGGNRYRQSGHLCDGPRPRIEHQRQHSRATTDTALPRRRAPLGISSDSVEVTASDQTAAETSGPVAPTVQSRGDQGSLRPWPPPQAWPPRTSSTTNARRRRPHGEAASEPDPPPNTRSNPWNIGCAAESSRSSSPPRPGQTG